MTDIDDATPCPDEEPVYAQDSPETRARVKKDWEDFRRKVVVDRLDPTALLEGVEKVFSTAEAAEFFGRSNQWIYWGLRNEIFTYVDGTLIQPERVGKLGRRRFTLPIIREIALSCYRRGNMSQEELESIMAKVLLSEWGEGYFAPETIP